jgi:hypothetical protein
MLSYPAFRTDADEPNRARVAAGEQVFAAKLA